MPFEFSGTKQSGKGSVPWNGVAILARNHIPVLTCASLPGNPEDHQARYIEAAVQGVLITSVYLPNGYPQPGPKFSYKLAWFERLIAHAAELMASGAPVVLAGDYNVVPTAQDIYPTRSLDDNALIQPESRQAFARLLAQGWTDAMRGLHPDGPLWTPFRAVHDLRVGGDGGTSSAGARPGAMAGGDRASTDAARIRRAADGGKGTTSIAPCGMR